MDAAGLERSRLRAAFSAQIAHSFSGRLKNGPRFGNEGSSSGRSDEEEMPSADFAGAGRTRDSVSRG